MEKITLKALELAGFKNADMIAKIISYVPNPQAATEMLLGVYTQSQIELANRFRSHRYSRPNEFIEMLEIDDLGNTIKYRHYKQKTQRVWYLSKEDKDNNVYVTDRPNGSYDYADIQAQGFDTADYEKTIADFNQDWSNPLSVTDAYAKLEEWENYGAVIASDLHEDLF